MVSVVLYNYFMVSDGISIYYSVKLTSMHVGFTILYYRIRLIYVVWCARPIENQRSMLNGYRA
jgi:hypothetical protein